MRRTLGEPGLAVKLERDFRSDPTILQDIDSRAVAARITKDDLDDSRLAVTLSAAQREGLRERQQSADEALARLLPRYVQRDKGAVAAPVPRLRRGISKAREFKAIMMHDGVDRQEGDNSALGGSVEDDVAVWAGRRAATPEELAEVLPSWASAMMQDEAAFEEYTSAQSTQRAQAQVPVEGREWGKEEEADIGAFTPVEIGEDFGVPAEAVLAFAVEIGVGEGALAPRRPLREWCSASQVLELSQRMQGADPIQLRDERANTSLAELAAGMSVEPQALLRLCKRLDIRADLAEDSHLRWVEFASLKATAEREFGEPPPESGEGGGDLDDGAGGRPGYTLV